MAKPASGTALDTGNALYTGLTNAWGLLEGTGTTCADSKGGNTATISGGVTWTTDADGPLLTCTGVSGKALLASLIDLIPGFASTGSWTIAWRATCTGSSGKQSAMGYAAYGYRELMSTGVSLEVHSQGSHQFTGVTDFSTLDDYMVVAESRTVLKLYHNGTLVDTATGCDTWNSIGAFCGEEATNFFEGTFSYLYIWVGTALSAGNAATLASDPYALFGAGSPLPTVANANVDAAGTTLTINFTVPGTTPMLPASSVTGFTLKAGGVSTGSLTSTAISGTAYTATTGRTITTGETLTLDYAPGNVEDSASNALDTFSGTLVANNVGGGAHAFTSQRDGDWNVPSGTGSSPWYDGGTQSGWNSVPEASNGDTATIAHDVTATANISIGDGTASTVLTVATGTLTVTGCTLTIRGNAALGAYNAGTVIDCLSILSSGGASASLLLDGNSGVTPHITTTYDTQLIFTGSAAHRVTVRTKSGSAGNPGYITNGGNPRSLYLQAEYVDFSYLGGATQAGMIASGVTDTSIGHQFWTMDHCNIDHCGQFPILGIDGVELDFSITYCVWSNPTDADGITWYMSCINALTTGVRLYAHNITPVAPTGSGVPVFWTMRDVTFTDNFFGNTIATNSATPKWMGMDSCFLYQSTTYGASDTHAMGGDVTNCFILLSDPHPSYFSLCSNDASGCLMSGNVIQSTKDDGDDYRPIFGTGEEGPDDHTITFSHNLVIPNFSGGLSGYLATNYNNSLQDFISNMIVNHNTVVMGPDTGFDFAQPTFVGGMTASGGDFMREDEISEFKSNLIVKTGTGTGCFAVQAFYTEGPVVDALAAANADYNAYGAMDTIPSGWFTTGAYGGAPVAGAGGEVGSFYDTPMGGTPGTHDIHFGTLSSLTSEGPQFVDPTRGLLEFDTHMGGDGTLSHAIASLLAQYDSTNPDYIVGYTTAALVTWVKAGWVPTNLALHNTAHDGTDIGALAMSVSLSTFVLSPGRTTQAGGSITVTATGTNTEWTGVTASGLFTKSGGTGASISSISVISDTLATFTLAPGSVAAALVITDTSTSNTLTFIVEGTGTYVGIGSTLLSPQCGPNPSLAFDWFDVPGAYWAAFLRSVASDAVSPYNATWQAFMAATQGATIRTSFYGSQPDAAGTGYGNMAVGNPINQVPGNIPLHAATIWEYPNDSDAGPFPLWPAMSIEGWPFGSSNADNRINGFVGITNGSASVTGSGTNFTQLFPGDRICFEKYGVASPPASTFYTVAAVASDTALTLTANYTGTSRIVADEYELYGPFNRPPNYDQSYSLGDSRSLILMRNEGTGQPTKLWELWYPSYSIEDGWQLGASAYWDLTTGAQRLDGLTSDTAGGTPCLPFLVRWEECNAGTISHPLRCAIASGIGTASRCIWPCTHAASASGTDWTQGTIPLGSVIRLNAAWLTANRASFPAIVRPILDAAAEFGLHVNDYTSGVPFEIDLVQDSRWNRADLVTLWAIPVTAFELIDSIKPQYTLAISAGPYTTGNAITFTIAYVGDTQYSFANTNFDPVTAYVQYSSDGGATWITGNSVVLTTSSRSGTCQFTPGAPGNYLFKTYQASGVWWLSGAFCSAAVSTSARALTTVQDGRWDDPATWGATPPAYGDTATVAHDVVMVGSATIGNGSGTALTCSAGTLLVVGCTLTVRGTISGSGASAVNSAGNTGSIVSEGAAATAYTLTGPSAGTVSVASTNFTVTPNGLSSGTVTPHTNGTGTFTPSSLTWTGDSAAKTFTYTPTSTSGSPHLISITSSPVLTYTGSPIGYTVNAAAATSYTFSGPSSGSINVASTNFTVTPNGSYSGSIALHTNGTGTFTPSSLTFSGSSSAQTFTYTPTTIVGSPHLISTTASPPFIANPAPVSYTVDSPLASGTAVRNSQGNTVAMVEVAAATGGTAPYTYQWYRSTSDGFTPGGGNIVGGATNRVLSDTGLTNATTYYYVCVVTDGVAATANSNQVSATPTASTARTLHWRWGAMLTPQWMLEGYKK